MMRTLPGRGFTLLEVVLSVAALAAIAGVGIPVYQSFQVRNDLDVAVAEIVQSAHRAQTLAQASDRDTSWGVRVQVGSIVVFSGTSYAARTAAYDEVFDLPASMTPSGLSEVVFTKFTGLPQQTGTITLTANANEVRTISINTKGVVSY
jgi:prepilin-type N-terminal cleavage/methylation domain-containing protein